MHRAGSNDKSMIDNLGPIRPGDFLTCYIDTRYA